MRLGGVARAQARGTDNVPTNVPRANPAVIAAALTVRGVGKSDRNAAALLREFRWLIAKSDGADSEPNLDREVVTGERDASNVVSGDEASASSARGMVEITWQPADMTAGAACR